MKTLSKIQKELKAPKNQFNKFGNYSYRNCEDILEAVKPLLGDAVLTLSDDIINIGDRYYIKATATISEGDVSISVSALAREALSQKGMSEAQLTGSTSSYARKYALNGLFSIDDAKDDDHRSASDNETVRKSKYITPAQMKELTDINGPKLQVLIKHRGYNGANTIPLDQFETIKKWLIEQSFKGDENA